MCVCLATRENIRIEMGSIAMIRNETLSCTFFSFFSHLEERRRAGERERECARAQVTVREKKMRRKGSP